MCLRKEVAQDSEAIREERLLKRKIRSMGGKRLGLSFQEFSNACGVKEHKSMKKRVINRISQNYKTMD